jgi:hypothetical protein
MINTQNLSAQEREEIIKNRLSSYTMITGFYDIDTMHTTLHMCKTDYPDQKFYVDFNGIYFLSDDEDLTVDFMYQTITGENRREHKEKQTKSMAAQRTRDVERQLFTTKRISDFIKAGLKILPETLWEDWIDLVPMRVSDLYNGCDLEWFIELHLLLSSSTFEHCKMVFETQGHSGMSASIVFQMLEKFTPNGKDFVKFLKGK